MEIVDGKRIEFHYQNIFQLYAGLKLLRLLRDIDLIRYWTEIGNDGIPFIVVQASATETTPEASPVMAITPASSLLPTMGAPIAVNDDAHRCTSP